jgi:RNA polymerase sigma-70 factor (ECF subfamily)
LPLSSFECKLLKRAHRRDRAAFSELYVAYYRAVYLEIYGLTRDRDETDDLTSEAFLRAWNAIGRFEDRGYSLETWLKRIARNLALSHIGRRGREAPSVELDLLIDPSLTPDEQADAAFENEAVRQAMVNLPAIQRQVLALRFFDDMSYNEVAEVIGKPQGTIRVIQHRALRAMRELLEKGRLKPALPPASGGGE